MATIEVLYDTDQDRADAIAANIGNVLVHDHIGEDEKYLIFDDTPFDLDTEQLKALLKIIIDELNILRTHPAIGLNPRTYTQARDLIKTELDL